MKTNLKKVRFIFGIIVIFLVMGGVWRFAVSAAPAAQPPVYGVAFPIVMVADESKPAPVVPTVIPTATPVPELDLPLQALYFFPDFNPYNGPEITPYLAVNRQFGGPSGLHRMAVRYWFTSEQEQQHEYVCYWAGTGSTSVCDSVNAQFVKVTDGATPLYYLELTFDSSAGSLEQANAPFYINGRINKSDWTNFDQRDDYSYNSDEQFAEYAPSDQVTLYYAGSLVWGEEPNGVGLIQPTPTSAATTPPNATSTPLPPPPTNTPPPNATSTPVPPPTSTPVPLPTATPINFTGGFVETLDNLDPAEPIPWTPDNWELTVHSRDRETWFNLEGMEAMHGEGCDAPPATHFVNTYENSVYNCRNHVMTAIKASGYGMIYLTPNHMIDFTNGEAVIQFDMSTARDSGRDFVDVWITPFDENLQLALDHGLPDVAAEPLNSVRVRLGFNNNHWRAEVIDDFQVQKLPVNYPGVWEDFLVPDSRRRDTFELRISRDHLTFGMPDYDIWWVDTPMEPLDWSYGVVQFGHHSYNPEKDCLPVFACRANTWHWDNFVMTPTRPFTLIKADRRYVDPSTTDRVNFSEPAPADSYLRFAGISDDLEVRFGDGAWVSAEKQIHQEHETTGGRFQSYWMPIPQGTTQVSFRGEGWFGGDWHVRDISIFSEQVPTTGGSLTADEAQAILDSGSLSQNTCEIPDHELDTDDNDS